MAWMTDITLTLHLPLLMCLMVRVAVRPRQASSFQIVREAKGKGIALVLFIGK